MSWSGRGHAPAEARLIAAQTLLTARGVEAIFVEDARLETRPRSRSPSVREAGVTDTSGRRSGIAGQAPVVGAGYTYTLARPNEERCARAERVTLVVGEAARAIHRSSPARTGDAERRNADAIPLVAGETRRTGRLAIARRKADLLQDVSDRALHAHTGEALIQSDAVRPIVAGGARGSARRDTHAVRHIADGHIRRARPGLAHLGRSRVGVACKACPRERVAHLAAGALDTVAGDRRSGIELGRSARIGRQSIVRNTNPGVVAELARTAVCVPFARVVAASLQADLVARTPWHTLSVRDEPRVHPLGVALPCGIGIRRLQRRS